LSLAQVFAFCCLLCCLNHRQPNDASWHKQIFLLNLKHQLTT